MNMRKLLLGAAGMAVAATTLVGSPADAAPTATTIVTFDVTGAGLDITAPPTAYLGSGLPGTTISGSLGTVQVTDSRGGPDASWVASVTATNFETGGGTSNERVLASDVDYWSGPATSTTGNGSFVPGQPTASAARPLANTVPLTAFTHIGGTGVNSAAWTPTLVVHIPLNDQVGTYSGTVTHSVA